jgi:Tol biopolymer transport system component
MRLRHHLPIVLVVLALAPPAAVAQPASYTLEQVLSAPFPSSLVAAPSGGLVAWVSNDRGERNIWVAGPPEYRGRPLTTYRDDTGQEIGSLVWTPDARAIVYVVGGNASRQGEHPNPMSSPEPVEQAIWMVSLERGEPWRIGQGNAPAVSPAGDRVAWINRGQAWWSPLDGEPEPEPAFGARGQIGSLRWSPDGSKLAFVSSRGGHSFVGVFEVAGRGLRYLDPSVDHDGHPVWSPDGRQLAFIRIPASRALFVFGPRREAEPWSIRMAEVASGRGREVWKAAGGPGSAFQGVSADTQTP